MPKLSVVVPIYNTEKYLRNCIDSILAQSFSDFELILVDDGSTDKSYAICDEYGKTDARVRVIHQENGGVTAARKRGAAAAAGEYLSFLDSDDWIEPDMFETMLAQAEAHDADMVFCDMIAEKPSHSTVIRSSELTGLFDSEQLEQQIYTNMLFDFSKNAPALSLNLCNKLIKSTVAKPVFAAFPSTVTYGEDALGCLACLLESTCIYILQDAALYHYRQTDEFLAREQSVSLLPRLSEFAKAAQIQFLQHSFDGSEQLSCYIAQVSLYCVRQILLFCKTHTLRKKLRLVRDYFEEAHIAQLLRQAQPLLRDQKLQKKVELVNQKHLLRLFGYFCGKELVLRAKRCLQRR